jgi:hypothetical protein
VVAWHVEKRVVLESTSNADHANHLQIWLCAQRRQQLAQRNKKGHLPPVADAFEEALIVATKQMVNIVT